MLVTGTALMGPCAEECKELIHVVKRSVCYERVLVATCLFQAPGFKPLLEISADKNGSLDRKLHPLVVNKYSVTPPVRIGVPMLQCTSGNFIPHPLYALLVTGSFVIPCAVCWVPGQWWEK